MKKSHQRTIARYEAMLRETEQAVSRVVNTSPIDATTALELLEDYLDELGDAIKSAEKALPRLARYRLGRAYDHCIQTLFCFVVACRLVHKEKDEAFWDGAAQAFLVAEREDLLAEFPEADKAALRIEATNLLKCKPPAS